MSFIWFLVLVYVVIFMNGVSMYSAGKHTDIKKIQNLKK